MDAASKRYRGAGHRLFNHTLGAAAMLSDYYRKLDPTLSEQSYREVVLHIAFDRGLIHHEDVVLMREYTRQTQGKKPLKPRNAT